MSSEEIATALIMMRDHLLIAFEKGVIVILKKIIDGCILYMDI